MKQELLTLNGKHWLETAHVTLPNRVKIFLNACNDRQLFDTRGLAEVLKMRSSTFGTKIVGYRMEISAYYVKDGRRIIYGNPRAIAAAKQILKESNDHQGS
jgi:hypothetical protein